MAPPEVAEEVELDVLESMAGVVMTTQDDAAWLGGATWIGGGAAWQRGLEAARPGAVAVACVLTEDARAEGGARAEGRGRERREGKKDRN